MIKYSFIVVCYNQWACTKEAIVTLMDSMEEKNIREGIELIMVDNGSTDETKAIIEWVMEEYTNEHVHIQPIWLKENMGYPTGVNIGLTHVRGEYIIVMNNDLIFIKGWLEPLINALEEDENLGVATPHISYGSGVAHVGVVIEDPVTIQAYGIRYMDKNKHKITYVDRALGALTVMKKSVTQKVGGNDPWYGIGHYDDDDLSLRVRIAGYKIAVIGGSFVYHQGSKTFREYYPEQSYYVALNRKKFLHKWQLKEDRLVDNQYIDRQAVIKGRHFSKSLHYIPIKKRAHSNKHDYHPKGRLWVADWTNEQSAWKESIEEVKPLLQQGEKVYVWVPLKYYTDSERHLIQEQIMGLLEGESNENLRFLSEYIAPIGLHAFLNGFCDLIRIKGDFVNKAMIYQKTCDGFNQP